jgi:hypothetical protein
MKFASFHMSGSPDMIGQMHGFPSGTSSWFLLITCLIDLMAILAIYPQLEECCDDSRRGCEEGDVEIDM